MIWAAFVAIYDICKRFTLLPWELRTTVVGAAMMRSLGMGEVGNKDPVGENRW